MELDRLKQLEQEKYKLNELEISTQLVNFFKNEYDLTAYVNKYKNYLDVYLSGTYQTEEVVEDKGRDAIATKVMKFYNGLDVEKKAVAVWQTEYGYVIVFDDEEASEEKMVNESLLYYYWYAEEDKEEENPSVFDLRQKIIKENKVIDALDELERGEKEIETQVEKPKREAPRRTERPTEVKKEIGTDVEDVIDVETEVLDKDEVETVVDSSNVILDNRFIWFFTIADELGEELATGITDLDEAIDILQEVDGAFLVAIPYVDPDPENDDVDIVPADEPGPQFVYTREGL